MQSFDAQPFLALLPEQRRAMIAAPALVLCHGALHDVFARNARYLEEEADAAAVATSVRALFTASLEFLRENAIDHTISADLVNAVIALPARSLIKAAAVLRTGVATDASEAPMVDAHLRDTVAIVINVAFAAYKFLCVGVARQVETLHNTTDAGARALLSDQVAVSLQRLDALSPLASRDSALWRERFTVSAAELFDDSVLGEYNRSPSLIMGLACLLNERLLQAMPSAREWARRDGGGAAPRARLPAARRRHIREWEQIWQPLLSMEWLLHRRPSSPGSEFLSHSAARCHVRLCEMHTLAAVRKGLNEHAVAERIAGGGGDVAVASKPEMAQRMLNSFSTLMRTPTVAISPSVCSIFDSATGTKWTLFSTWTKTGSAPTAAGASRGVVRTAI